MAERDRLEPVDADMDAVGVIPARDLQVLALGRPCADEDRVIPLVEQRLHAVDAMVQAKVDAHVEDVADLLVEDLRRQPELRNIGSHQSAGRLQRLEDRHVVAQRTQIVGDRQ